MFKGESRTSEGMDDHSVLSAYLSVSLWWSHLLSFGKLFMVFSDVAVPKAFSFSGGGGSGVGCPYLCSACSCGCELVPPCASEWFVVVAVEAAGRLLL